ncbi:hypothetical protein B0H34DRAFT_723734, partial [Crassisporium funariophilum]
MACRRTSTSYRSPFTRPAVYAQSRVAVLGNGPSYASAHLSLSPTQAPSRLLLLHSPTGSAVLTGTVIRSSPRLGTLRLV